MTRAVFSMVSEMRFMPSMVRPTASSPVRASSEAFWLMRSASSAILATSLTADAMSDTVLLVRWAATVSDSALRATCAMNVAISSTVPEVSVTVPARCSRLRATWSMETVICSMVDAASVTVPASTPTTSRPARWTRPSP